MEREEAREGGTEREKEGEREEEGKMEKGTDKERPEWRKAVRQRVTREMERER